jgi:hypothetical protein
MEPLTFPVSAVPDLCNAVLGMKGLGEALRRAGEAAGLFSRAVADIRAHRRPPRGARIHVRRVKAEKRRRGWPNLLPLI